MPHLSPWRPQEKSEPTPSKPIQSKLIEIELPNTKLPNTELPVPETLKDGPSKKSGQLESEDSDVKTHIPTLVETVRFSGDLHLCGEKIPFTDPEVRERLEKEMMLAVWNRPQVMLWLKRAHRWFPHIERALKKEKLPLDLKYLPIVESALLSYGESPQGAVGYWQFIASTGRRYGLRIDSKIDERRNMFRATQAACLYLKDLYDRFDSYLLAMSAYNMGENGLSKAMSLQETRIFSPFICPWRPSGIF